VRSVWVFCSSRPCTEPVYEEAARALGGEVVRIISKAIALPGGTLGDFLEVLSWA
jgi:predicted Rossmann-fold nucleotide-binding protein